MNDMSPKFIWLILTSKHKILGPWREAKGKNWSQPEGWRRFSPKGPDGRGPYVSVFPWDKPDEPDETDFYEWGGRDEERYEAAIKKWKIESARWKPWTYTFSLSDKDIDRGNGYADTKEEAQLAVDKVLTELNYILYNGD